MRVTHEDVADLVGDARRQPPPIPEVEKQAAGLMAQAHMEQWVAKHPVDERGIDAAYPRERTGSLTGVIVRQEPRGWRIVDRCSGER